MSNINTVKKRSAFEREVDFLVTHISILCYGRPLEEKLSAVDKTEFDQKVKDAAKERLAA